MALPTQIQQQLDRAESTLQQLNALPVAPAAEAVEAAPVQAAPVQAAPAVQAAPVEAAPQKTQTDEFRQKYLVLQGMHRSFEDKIRAH